MLWIVEASYHDAVWCVLLILVFSAVSYSYSGALKCVYDLIVGIGRMIL